MDNENGTVHMDVERICELAHFDMTSEEMSEYQDQLDRILEYVEMLRQLDLDGIEPTMYGQPVANNFREDIVVPGLTHDEVIRNAPDQANGEIKVPKVVE